MLERIKQRLERWVGNYHAWVLEERMLNNQESARNRLKALCLHLDTLPLLPNAYPTDLTLYTPTMKGFCQAWMAVAQGMRVGDYPHFSRYIFQSQQPTTIEVWATTYLIQESVRGVPRDATWLRSWRELSAAASDIEVALANNHDYERTYGQVINKLLVDASTVLRAARKGWEV